MSNANKEELVSSKEFIKNHDYFKRSEGITQILPQNISIRDVGAMYSPIKADFQEGIKRFETQLKKLPISRIKSNENVDSFLNRYLEIRSSQERNSKLSLDLSNVSEMMEGKDNTKNNRKKHSLEVASIAKELGKKLKLTEEDILTAEITSLCHDLGHAPYGHSGQKAISSKLKSMGLNEYLSDDNLQALDKAKEMGVDDRVMQALIYHDGKPIKDVEHRYNANNLQPYFHKFINDREKAPSIAAQVAAISDDIANDSRDIVDIYKAGVRKTVFAIWTKKQLIYCWKNLWFRKPQRERNTH
ncbi:MAG: HD domain-containing protein [Rickettsiales bacterium]|nr:HD domain-containing protein [Pseudomonadota bacterium]MDA0967466.1 HD domain-containing protein [Pseudomonadota bacterium]MDG4544166.1 HD domain-containing protein [Rickettsiales bacterium]MDG4546347.1 HD domain-containing protein [Rickettsiales bacterium]MDG4548490.1 HD domain-containing protein [Rickettsiales bacterium]